VLLQQVSTRLVKCLRIRDTVGRLGGDEFALVLVTTGTLDAGRRVAEKVGDVLRQPVSLTGGRVAVTVSIGVAVNEAGSVDGPTLVAQADAAMYAAKAAGGDGYRVHAPGAENGALSWPMAWRPVSRMGNASRRQT
jgi:diguanylate cyclase (GGDEF)-like protein